jgi:molybdopterin converting factor small subunit
LSTTVEAATVGELLEQLGITDRLCDDTGKLRRHFNIHVNGSEDIRLLAGMDTSLADGDTVAILSAIAGGSPAQVARKVWLTFTEDLVEEPLIWQVAQKFKVVTNIRQASISKHIGLVGLELSGEEHEVAKAIEFFAKKGVSVEPVEQDVVE